jgi:IMP dehydrogenase/GMP reductase
MADRQIEQAKQLLQSRAILSRGQRKRLNKK